MINNVFYKLPEEELQRIQIWRARGPGSLNVTDDTRRKGHDFRSKLVFYKFREF
jgi:hypothetical protein